MIYLKHYEHFREIKSGEDKPEQYPYHKVPHSIDDRDEAIRYATMVETLFNGLGFDVIILRKDSTSCFYKWTEVIINMNLTQEPYSLLNLLLGYLNPSKKFSDRESVYFLLKHNLQKYGHLKDKNGRIPSFKLLFTRAHSVNDIKLEPGEDPKDWFLFNPSTPEEALKLTIREFLKLVNSCTDKLSNSGVGFSSLFGLSEDKKVPGIRHFINNYLKGHLVTYDIKTINNSVIRVSGDVNFYNAMEYQKNLNPEIFKLFKIPEERMNTGKNLKDKGFYD